MFNEKIAKLLDGKKAVGYEKINVTSAGVVVLTPTAHSKPEDKPYFALITPVLDSTATVTTSAINFRLDGTAPDATNGLILGQGGMLMLSGFDQISNFKAIATEAGKTHTLRVQYFKLGSY